MATKKNPVKKIPPKKAAKGKAKGKGAKPVAKSGAKSGGQFVPQGSSKKSGGALIQPPSRAASQNVRISDAAYPGKITDQARTRVGRGSDFETRGRTFGKITVDSKGVRTGGRKFRNVDNRTMGQFRATRPATNKAPARSSEGANTRNIPDPGRNNPARIQNFALPSGTAAGTPVGRNAKTGKPIGVVGGAASFAQITEAANITGKKAGGSAANQRAVADKFATDSTGGPGAATPAEKPANLTQPPSAPAPQSQGQPSAPDQINEASPKPEPIASSPRSNLSDQGIGFGGEARSGTKGAARKVAVAAALDLPPNRRRRRRA